MKRIILALALLACAVSPLWAQTGTPKSKAVLSAEIGTCFPPNTTGQITPATVQACMQDFLASWQQFAGVDARITTAETINPSDYGQLVTFNNASATAVTLPQAISPFATFNFYASNLGAGTVTITPSSGTINGAASLTLVQGQSALIISDDTNYQVFQGGGGLLPIPGTSGGIPYYNTANSLASSALLTNHALVLGGGAGGAPTTVGSLGTTTTLLHGNPSGAPSFGSVNLTTDVSGILPAANGGTANGFTAFSGPATSTKTYTLPNSSQALAALDLADQTVSGGANVTTLSQSTGNLTVDCGARPLQSITNGGVFTITAPSSDGSCMLKVTNNASAGAITFTGFTESLNTGDALTTTNTSIFFISIARIGGTSNYVVRALQ